MPNQYQDEIQDDELLRDILILDRINAIYRDIRQKAQAEARSVKDKAGNDNTYFTKERNQVKFQEDFSKAVRPDYVKRDAFSKKAYIEEYNTAYMQSKYSVINQGIKDGYKFRLPNYTDKQFKEARDYALSKLMNKAKMTTGRNLNIAQLEDIIVTGVQQGLSLKNINRDIDIALGFRDSAGKWIGNKDDLKGQRYQTERILRTEIGRMRKRARIDQWVMQQPVVPSKLMLVAVKDDRTRKQSIQVDGEIANEEGKFRYPDGSYYYPGETGRPQWDIQDREEVIPLDEEYPPESQIERDPSTGQNVIMPYRSFEEYAKDNNLTKNRYGQYLFK